VTTPPAEAAALVAEADAILSAPNAIDAAAAARALEILTVLETATPGGAPLHHQIDVVRRWVGVLRDEPEHARFGGTPHLRSYLGTQLRLLRAAVDDYLRS
jgi:hypothetical protein